MTTKMISSNKYRTLGTKAETLLFLRSKLKRSTICDAVVFSVADWRADKNYWLEMIEKKFMTGEVIVRSSAVNEDSPMEAMAGYYHSVGHVALQDKPMLIHAIEKVIESYSRSDNLNHINCQVLIQPMIKNISMSGVVFTQDLNTGAPYYVINYDDESGKTDTITSGNGAPNKTLLVFRKARVMVKSKRIRMLMEAVQEIENLTGLDTLDIEFALTHDEVIYIFQVRPITTKAHWNRGIFIEIEDMIERVANFIRSKQKAVPGLFGASSIFGQMPDWNPAEMIGSAPHPLDLSLYRYLITDRTWRVARSRMGYAEPVGVPLMVSLCGQPYIDVRASFHSFIPEGLNHDVARKIVNAWLDRLRQNPQFHDKVEFEIAITALTFDFDQAVERIMPGILRASEVNEFRRLLLALTDGFLCGRKASMSEEIQKIEKLERHRKSIIETRSPAGPLTIRRLLNQCVKLGTLPFAVLARHGFVAKSLLLSLVTCGVLTEADVESLMRTIPTVATGLIEDTKRVRSGHISQADFFAKYGHLRPGTYDILSLRYDQRPSIIFNRSEKSTPVSQKPTFSLSKAQVNEINTLLEAGGFSVRSDDLFTYIRSAVQARELAKFVFSNSLSDALEITAHYGEEIGLSREELSFLTIQEIMDADIVASGRTLEHELRRRSRQAAAVHEITRALRLPHLIINAEDVHVVPIMRCQPNFVTRKKIRAHHILLNGHNGSSLKISGKVVLIESADPGYDWIFSHNIAGLVTKFGGANSHMAIRCAELDIPAAIGCGDQMFDRMVKASEISLDCGAELLVPII